MQGQSLIFVEKIKQVKKFLSILFVLIASLYMAVYAYIPHHHSDMDKANMEMNHSSSQDEDHSDPNPFHKDFCSVDHHNLEAKSVLKIKPAGNMLMLSDISALPVLWENLLIELFPEESTPPMLIQPCTLYTSVVTRIHSLRAPPAL